MKQKIFKIYCKNCKNSQKTIVRKGKVYGKTRRCVYCGKTITMNRFNTIPINSH